MCIEILILFCILIARADFNDLLLREVTWKPASQNSLKTQQTANEYRLAAASHRVHFCNTKHKNYFKPAFFGDTIAVCFDSLITSSVWCPAAREPKLMNEIGVFWFAALFLGAALAAGVAASLTTFWQDSCSEKEGDGERARRRGWNRGGLRHFAP